MRHGPTFSNRAASTRLGLSLIRRGRDLGDLMRSSEYLIMMSDGILFHELAAWLLDRIEATSAPAAETNEEHHE